MKVEQVLELVKAVSDSELTEFKYEEDGVKLSLKKTSDKIVQVPAPAAPVAAPVIAPAMMPAAPVQAAAPAAAPAPAQRTPAGSPTTPAADPHAADTRPEKILPDRPASDRSVAGPARNRQNRRR